MSAFVPHETTVPAGPRPDAAQPQTHSIDRPPVRGLPLRGPRISIIGINYQPEPTGIAPYTTGIAEFLSEAEASVTVLTGVPHYPAWQVPGRYRGRVRYHEKAHGGVEVVRHAHYVPGRQTALTRATYELSFMANVLTNPPDRPDLVIAVSPSLGGAVAGARLAKRYKVPLITIVQDLMAKAASQSGISGGSSVAEMTARMEGFALRRSTLVAVVSDAFFSRVRDYGVPSERIRLLPNWTHIKPTSVNRDAARRHLQWPTDNFIVLHSGNMGLKQDLGNVVEAARLLSFRRDVSFVLLGDGSQRSELETSARGLSNIRFVDPLSDVDYPLALAAADLLLVNERTSVGDMSLPSKITSYLASGRPVLAAVAPDGATAGELKRTGAAVLVGPGAPKALADAVTRLAVDNERRDRMAAAGSAFARAHLGKATAMDRLTALIAEALQVR
jgi:glycosyltransferase involved in cell wall biosynthesis